MQVPMGQAQGRNHNWVEYGVSQSNSKSPPCMMGVA